MGVNDLGEQHEVLIEEFNILEAQLERIRNAIESPVDASVKVSLVTKVLEGH